MDITTILVIAGLTIAILIVAVVLIWRSRSESIIRIPVAGPSAPGSSPGPGVATELEAVPGDQGELVPIQHPLVRRSAEQALKKGGPMTRYIVQQGDQLFFTFEAIADPAERQRAYDLMRRFNAGDDIDLRAFMNVIKQMTND